jgi:hypothetical protein
MSSESIGPQTNSYLPSVNTLPSQSPQGFDIFEIQNLDLQQFRSSALPRRSYWLLLVPVIGWIALACLKGLYVLRHRAAEKMILDIDRCHSVNEKIELVSKVIQASGPHAWQYLLERASLHLHAKKYQAAAVDLAAAQEQRGLPSQTGNYNVRAIGLISFVVANTPGVRWEDGKYVMRMQNHTGEEALLRATVYAANQRYPEAYDAYNEVMYYNQTLSDSRKHQVALVNAMATQPQASLSGRGRQIVSAERAVPSH